MILLWGHFTPIFPHPKFPFLHFQCTSLPFFTVFLTWCTLNTEFISVTSAKRLEEPLGARGWLGRGGVCSDWLRAEAQMCYSVGNRRKGEPRKEMFLCEVIESSGSHFSLIQKDGRMEITWSESLKVFKDSNILLCLLISVKLMYIICHLSRTWWSLGADQKVCVGRVNSQLRGSTRRRACVGLARGGVLTVKSKAGMGVQRFTWIMANTLGRWPSLAPAKNSLAERKAGQPGMDHGLPKETPSPARAPSSIPLLPTQEHPLSNQVPSFSCTSSSLIVTGPTVTNAGAGKPEAASG